MNKYTLQQREREKKNERTFWNKVLFTHGKEKGKYNHLFSLYNDVLKASLIIDLT